MTTFYNVYNAHIVINTSKNSTMEKDKLTQILSIQIRHAY